MSIPVRARRVIIRLALACDVACAAAIVILTSLRVHHSWAGGFLAFGFLCVSVVTGLLYLRSTRGRS